MPDNLIARLREHDDPRLYHEADVLMSEAADKIAELERKLYDNLIVSNPPNWMPMPAPKPQGETK